MSEAAAKALPYRDNPESLSAELDWLDAALLELVRAARPADESGHGWFVSASEAEARLRGAGKPDAEACARLNAGWRELAARRAASGETGPGLALPHLAMLFGLSGVEQIALLACFAAEIDAKYGRVFGYLHDDLTRRQPTIGLILELARLAPDAGTVDALLFPDDAPLFRWRLVEAGADGPNPSRSLWLDPRITAFLMGQPRVDSRIRPALEPCPELSAGLDWEDCAAVEQALGNAAAERRGRLVVSFHGESAAAGELVMQRVCRRLGMRLMRVNLAELAAMASGGWMPFREGLRRVLREALLQPAAVYFCGLAKLLEDPEAGGRLRVLDEMLDEVRWFTAIENERMWMPEPPRLEAAWLPFHFGPRTRDERSAAWLQAVSDASLSREQLETISSRYRAMPREAAASVRLARARAEARDGRSPNFEYDDLIWACRARSQARLGPLARLVKPRARWEHLVCPPHTLAQLREICAQIERRSRVLHDWGFERRFSLGMGAYALFIGASGSGKTLAAEVIAAELGLDLLKVDLSAVVSKYIGETEKNLNRVFDGAEHSDAVLFFDEADALFGRRTEIRDAHDRYANLEVNFLLQRLEEYQGIVILASNFAQNIDDSFARRMQFTVEFPFPGEALRLQIWRNHFPRETPLAAGVDLEYMAREFKVAGGSIRKIVLRAAYLAADDGGEVSMDHLLLATRREYERMGKLYPAGVAE